MLSLANLRGGSFHATHTHTHTHTKKKNSTLGSCSLEVHLEIAGFVPELRLAVDFEQGAVQRKAGPVPHCESCNREDRGGEAEEEASLRREQCEVMRHNRSSLRIVEGHFSSPLQLLHKYQLTPKKTSGGDARTNGLYTRRTLC